MTPQALRDAMARYFPEAEPRAEVAVLRRRIASGAPIRPSEARWRWRHWSEEAGQGQRVFPDGAGAGRSRPGGQGGMPGLFRPVIDQTGHRQKDDHEAESEIGEVKMLKLNISCSIKASIDRM